MQQYATTDYGNPSSSHLFGQKAGQAIREARIFFSEQFRCAPEQIIFTGSGTEANNLAISGLSLYFCVQSKKPSSPIQVITSSTEHASVRKTVTSLKDFGIHSEFIPVHRSGQPDILKLEEALQSKTTHSILLSLHQVNSIVGTIFDLESIAKKVKKIAPHLIIHADSVQAFGKIPVPRYPSSIDVITLSGHKIEGPKGVGALIVLNKNILPRIRPILWGGEQENGLRAGTQNAGLIAGFHEAAQQALHQQDDFLRHTSQLRNHFRSLLERKNLLKKNDSFGSVHWNSPENSIPNIINLSVPGLPSGALTQLLEERKCLVSVGSACSSQKTEKDPVLKAMGFGPEIQNSSIRISFSRTHQLSEIEILGAALSDSIDQMKKMTQKSKRTLSS